MGIRSNYEKMGKELAYCPVELLDVNIVGKNDFQRVIVLTFAQRDSDDEKVFGISIEDAKNLRETLDRFASKFPNIF